MRVKIDPSERAVISDLLRDFAYDPSISVEEVYRKSWQRFQAIENETEIIGDLSEKLSDEDPDIKVQSYAALPLTIHKFIYNGLFKFAGSYREKHDPSGGGVHFGPQHAQKRKPVFQGDAPGEIKEGVYRAIRFLCDASTDNPLRAAICFYQAFIEVHPFYDANGRIARLIVNIFLYEYGLNINWSEFDSKSKFIKALNWCHKSKSRQAFDKLEKLIRKFTHKIDDLDSV